MRRSRFAVLAFTLAVVAAPLVVASDEAAPHKPEQSGDAPVDPSRAAFDTFISHLRANFEDIHEVSMRFHMSDPTQNGMMVVQMTWGKGRMEAATILSNETSAEEGEAILDVLRRWRIDELSEPATFVVPFRFRIVGSDDPRYPDMGIVTGRVTGPEGKPIPGAEIELVRDDKSLEPIRARANREGVYVRTLIPPGTWTAVCRAEGLRTAKIAGIELAEGTHRIVRFYLEPVEQVP